MSTATPTATAIFDFGLSLVPAEAHPYLLPVRELIETGTDKALDLAALNPTLFATLLKLAEQLVADLRTRHIAVTAAPGATVSFTVLPAREG